MQDRSNDARGDAAVQATWASSSPPTARTTASSTAATSTTALTPSAHGHKGICSESEWGPIARDLELAAETGCGYHVCHISCQGERRAHPRRPRRSGVDVTCETAPHYLVLDETMLQEDGRFKMNPPLRSHRRPGGPACRSARRDDRHDRDGPRAPQRRRKNPAALRGSLIGIVGLETAFPVLYTASGPPRHPAPGAAGGLADRQAPAALRLGARPPGLDAFSTCPRPGPIDPEGFCSQGRSHALCRVDRLRQVPAHHRRRPRRLGGPGLAAAVKHTSASRS